MSENLASIFPVRVLIQINRCRAEINIIQKTQNQ